MPPVTFDPAIQAQLENAQYNIANAPFSAESAAAAASIRTTNPEIYAGAMQNIDAKREAERSAAEAQRLNPLKGVDPRTLANMPQSEIAARFGPSGPAAVSEYFQNNPSARFQQTTQQYEASRMMSATMTNPLVQVPGGRFGNPSQEVAKPQLTPSPTEIGSVGTTITTPATIAPTAFESAANFFANAPVLSFFYGLGASVPKSEVAKVESAVKSTPVLSSIERGGAAYQLQSDYNRQAAAGLPSAPAAGYRYTSAAKELTGGFESEKAVTYGIGGGLQNLGKGYNEMITVPVSKTLGENPVGQFVTGLVSAPGELVSTAGQAIPGAEVAARNPLALPALAVAGTAMMIGSTVEAGTTNPAKLAGSLVGQALLFGGAKAAYEFQPYRVGIERATIIPSEGTGAPTARYSSLAVTKLSGADYQIAQVKAALLGVGGKAESPIDTVLRSDVLKVAPDVRFSGKENTFTTSAEAMRHFSDVAETQRNFYHATTTGNLGDTLLSTGKITIAEEHPGGLFFAEPETILTKYAQGPGTPVAIKLTEVPKITPEYLDVVADVKAGKTGAFGPGFVKTTTKLPEGFYPGVRPAAGKAFGTYGLEEEYIVTPGTNLYLKSLRSMEGPAGEKWLLAEVSLKKPLIPDVARGVVQTIADIKNMRLTAGVPEVPREYFDFGKQTTFAAQTPLETSIVKRLAPTESPKIDLGYGVHEITSGSGMKLQNAATAINEVVQANKFPNPGKVTEAILQTEIDYGVKIYGSSIQRGAGTETGITTLTRAPNDIDVYVPGSDKVPMGPSFASDVTAAINKAAGKTVVEVDSTGTVQMVGGKGKLFDIHNENPTELELLAQGSNPNRLGSEYYGIGMKPEKFLETPEGVGVMTYSEQVGRKLSGTSEFTIEPRTTLSKVYEGSPEEFSVTGQIGPRFEGRMKDIPDFYTGEKGNIELMRRSLNPLARVQAERANTMLESWLDQWGEGTAKNVRESYEIAQTAGERKYAIDLSSVGKYESEFSPASTFIKSVGVSPSLRPYSQSISMSTSPSPSPSVSFSQPILSKAPSMQITPSASWEISPAPERVSRSAVLSEGLRESVGLSPNISQGSKSFYEDSIGIPSRGIPSETTPSETGWESPFWSITMPSLVISPPSPTVSPPPPSPGPASPPSPPYGGGGGYTPIIPPPESPSLSILPPSSPEYRKRKQKQSPYFIFRELLPTVTPIEAVGGFKSGRPFYRAIGNQQILEVRPQARDWLHSVDIDEDVREVKAKETASKVSNLAGMQFFRTATKQEKAKTGQPILKYTPTQQEVDIAKLVGFKGKKGRKSWF